MKLLFDENLPKRLKEDFPDYEVYTVRDMGWNGKKDVELLKKSKEHGFPCSFDFRQKHQISAKFPKLRDYGFHYLRFK